MKQLQKPATDVDPCLFISEKVTCLTHVDDCIMVARDPADINFVMDKLRARKMDFEEEEDVAGFLGRPECVLGGGYQP